MSSSTLLSVFALFLICCVHQTEAQSGRVCVIRSRGNTNEDQGPVVFKLRRKQGTQGNVTVSYTLVDETTQPPDIMGERSGTVTFVDGQTMATISVKINDDDEQEDSEQFRIILSGDSIGAETSTSAIIADDDVYSPWGPWVGDCSVTCGPANKTETRNRTCISVRVERCVQTLNDSRIVDCNLTGCPIITSWSEWTDNGTCSTTCGPGTRMQFRNRTCTANCPDDFTSVETRTFDCEICLCPIISMWSEWTDEGTCSTTCGTGTQMQSRDRTCTNSTCCPANFESSQTRNNTCEICQCPTISMWTEWADEGPCSTTCGTGTQMQSRERTCTNSTCCPANFESSQTRINTCEICQCPTISTWTQWTDVRPCSTTCGMGTQMQSRDRTCTDSTCCPANFESSQTRNNKCEICPCPVIGPWCPWGNTGLCSVTCGCGTQMQARNRVCVNTCMPPDCIKREERTVTCTQAPCHTAWTTWNRWSRASTWNRWSGSTWDRWSGASTWNRWSGGSTRNRWSGSTRNRWSGSTRNRRRGSWRRRFYWG